MAHEVVSKCGVHCIGPKRIGYGDFLSRIAQAGRQLALVKCRDDMGAMDDALLLWPDLLTIGAKTEWDDAGYSVDEAYNRIMAAHHIDPKVKYWEYFNERDGDYRQQADLYIALMPRLAHEGIGLCMFNCASGTPQLPSIDEAPYREIARACAFMRANDYDAILGLHEYSSDGNTIERHNALTDYLAARHALIPIAITEYGFETYYFDDAAYMALVKDNDPEYMRHEVILGCALWTLGGGGWASANYQTMLPELGEYIATVEPVEPEPPLPDDDFPPIVVTAHLVPQDTTSAEYDIVQAAALPNKNDVIFSADVAKHIVLHGQPGSKVIVWQPDRWSDSITDYLAPAQVELRYFTPPIPPGAPAWRGLHMRADGHSQVKDFECLDVARCDAAKIMTNTDFDELHMLIASGIAPDRIVLRLFADFRDRVIFPEDFYDWQRAWLGEFTRSGGRYVEIHNEPNLPIEGYGTSWATPQSWGNWYNEVARLIRGSYASVLIGWPGLSPQPNAPLFDDPLRASIMAGLVDWIGAHSYWLNSGGVDSPADGRYYTRYLGFGKPVIVTEFSNVGTADSDRAKGEQYAYYYATLESVVLGAFAFVSSASDPLFNQRRETWQRNGSLTDIPRAVGAAA